jgi:hypothetical protein
MKNNLPTLEDWRKLYDVVIRVQEMAPWKWMEETNIFGVQNPETDELGFVSVMGIMGEYCAVAVYLGSKGLYGFWNLQNTESIESPDIFLEIPQLQVSFEDRNETHNRDREIIKKLGLKFRGHHAWPMFRSFRPGFLPWFLEANELRFMNYALEQTLDVALRFRENSALLMTPGAGNYLVRIPQKKNDTIKWEDQLIHVPPPEPSTISISMDIRTLETVKKLPQSNLAIEIDLFMVPTAIEEKDARPFYPYILFAVDAQSGLILGHDLLDPNPSLEDMWGLIPVHFVHQLARIGMIPEEIKVRSELLVQLLQPLTEDLDFKFIYSHTLPSLDTAKKALTRDFM